jgi:hypothetical protein
MEVEEQDIVKSNIEGDAGQLLTMNTVYHPKLTRKQKHNYRNRQNQILKRQTAAKIKRLESEPQSVQQPK